MLLTYFVAACVLIVLGYLILRIKVRKDYLNLGRISTIGLLLELLIIFLYMNFPYIYLPLDWPELPRLPESIPHSLAGLIPIGLGVVIAFIGITTLGLKRFLGFGSQQLGVVGIYRLSRNPQIVGFFLAIAGFAILWPSWYALGWMILYYPLFHMMVITEEEYLESLHGASYLRYCQRVPRYIGAAGN